MVEIRDSRCLLPRINRATAEFASDQGPAVTGGSDAHFPMKVGRAHTVHDTHVRDALRTGDTAAVGRDGYASGHIATKYHEALEMLGP